MSLFENPHYAGTIGTSWRKQRPLPMGLLSLEREREVVIALRLGYALDPARSNSKREMQAVCRRDGDGYNIVCRMIRYAGQRCSVAAEQALFLRGHFDIAPSGFGPFTMLLEGYNTKNLGPSKYYL